MFRKKDVLKNFRNFMGKHFLMKPFFNEVAFLRTCNFIKEDSDTGVFVWNFPNFFEKHLCTSASKLYLKGDSNTSVFI